MPNNFFRKSIHYIEKKFFPLRPDKFYYIGNQSPMISFAFDDFPVTAGINGAGILNKYDIKGTFFISLGILGQESNVGKISDLNIIKNLITDGHEIGSHTYGHVNRFDISLEDYEKSIIKNELSFKDLISKNGFDTFSYPYGIAGNRVQQIVKKYFRCARTSNIGVNFGQTDLNMLKAFPLYGRGEELDLMRSAIQFTIKENGWSIFYTHDVVENPSLFGCTPKYLEDVVKLSVESGAKIVTLKEACDILSVPKIAR